MSSGKQIVQIRHFYKLMVKHNAAIASYGKGKYRQALEHIQQYWIGVHEAESGEDLARQDRMCGGYSALYESWQNRLRQIEFYSFCKLEAWSEADRSLMSLNFEFFSDKVEVNIFSKVFEQSTHLPNSGKFLTKCWDYICDTSKWMAKGASDVQKMWVDSLVELFGIQLTKEPVTAGPLLCEFGDRAPGLSARIVLSEDPAEIAALWGKADSAEGILPQAYLHTMELGLPLPDFLYQLPSEELSAQAAALGKCGPKLPRVAAEWLTRSAPRGDPRAS